MEKAFHANKELIGKGHMAEIYLYKGYVYKCFKPSYPQHWIEYEINIQDTVSKTTLPTISYYQSEIPNSIKMDYLPGKTLTKRILNDNYKNGLEDLFALFLQIHEMKDMPLSPLRPYLEIAIDGLFIEAQIKYRALHTISHMNDGHTLCHLDYHFDNIMYSEGNYYIINWITARIGNPIFDFARTYIILYEFAREFSKKFMLMAITHLGCSEEEFLQAVYVMAVHRLTDYDSKAMGLLIEEL